MVNNPPDGMPYVTPYLFYNNIPAALDWLERTFGFVRQGEIIAFKGMQHAEMRHHSGVIMMGSAHPEQQCFSPLNLAGVNQSLYVYVADVDAHYAHCLGCQAPELTDPIAMFWGDRIYSARDLEGHHWCFAQHIQDIAPEDMRPPAN